MSIIIPANSAVSGGFDVANSCMFDGASARMTRTQGSGNRQIFTLSTWFKTAKTNADQTFYGSFADSSNYDYIFLNSSGQMNVNFRASGSNTAYVTTNRLFRDVSAWYHLVVAVDTTQGTSSNRIKIYINGVQETSFATATYPSVNTNTTFNNGGAAFVGSVDGSQQYFNGYLAEVVWLDGQALAPTSFGEFDEDSSIWKPIGVSGLTFGTSGYYLDFEDSSALGDDAAGSNNFSLTGIAATDQATDTCTNNFATLNSIYKNYNQPTFTQGNTTTSSASSGYFNAFSSIAVSTGKWYAEIKRGSSESQIGISSLNDAENLFPGTDYYIGETSKSLGISSGDGKYRIGTTGTTYGSSYTTGDIIGLALDLTNKKLYASKNGAWSNGSGTWDSTTFNASTGAIDISAVIPSGEYAYIGFSIGDPGTGFIANFGFPTFSISSGNADDDGYGNFEYDVPGGYFSLNSKNLAEYG